MAFLNKREMLKNVALLTGRTLVAQVLNIVASPVLYRLFTKGITQISGSLWRLLVMPESSLAYDWSKSNLISVVQKKFEVPKQ